MRKTLLAMLCCFFLSPVFAQRDLVNSFDSFSQELSTWCGRINDWGLDNVGFVNEATGWVCGLRPAIDRASRMVNNLTSDMNGLFSNSLNDIVGMATDMFGDVLGEGFDQEIAALVDGIQQGLEDGTSAFSSLAGQLLSKANRRAFDNLTAPPPAGAGQLENDASLITRRDPNRISAEMQQAQQTTQTLMRAARAQDISNTAREYAATSFARGDEEQLLKRTTSPDPTGLTKGVADEADEQADTANSSRAVFHASVKMQANAARLQAVSTANITTAIKELGVQQTMTTEQIGALIQTMSEAQLQEYKKWRSEYIEEMAEVTAGVRDVTQQLTAAGDMLRSP